MEKSGAWRWGSKARNCIADRLLGQAGFAQAIEKALHILFAVRNLDAEAADRQVRNEAEDFCDRGLGFLFLSHLAQTGGKQPVAHGKITPLLDCEARPARRVFIAAGDESGAGESPVPQDHEGVARVQADRALDFSYGAVRIADECFRPTEEMRLGLALSTRLSGQYHDPGRFAAVGTPRLIDLPLGLQSFRQGRSLADSVRFNGLSISRINALYADEDGEKKKGRSALVTGLMAVGVVALALVAVAGIACATNDNSKDFAC